MRRRGFTLVELLVVVGIIALLIALLMPSLSKVRKQALEVKCAANLRSVGQALTMYVQRHGYYPGCMSAESGSVLIWPTRLRQFTGGDQNVFHCPAQDQRCEWKQGTAGEGPSVPAGAVHAASFGYDLGEPLLFMHGTRFSYGYNWAGAGDSETRPRGLGAVIWADRQQSESRRETELPATRVRRPAEMVAIGDGTPDGVFDGVIGAGQYVSRNAWPGTIHRGGANILFVDGHVTWYVQKELVDFTGQQGPARRRVWHHDNEP